MPIISNALYAEKDSLLPSSLMGGETTGRIVGNVTKKKRLLTTRAVLMLPVNTGKANEQVGESDKDNRPLDLVECSK